MVLRPIRSGNAFEEAVERLLHAFGLGVVRAGERLPPERELAARLGVSRETLREALASLREAGWLESRRGRYGGTFMVAAPPFGRSSTPGPGGRPQSIVALDALRSRRELTDALDLRRVLETGAAELAAERRMDAAERALLLRLHDECCAATRGDLAAYRPADSRLHLAIGQASGSPSLAAAVADVRARVNDLLGLIPVIARNLEHSNDQHGRVVAAILAGDPPGARSAMVEHLAGTAALLRGFLS